jgi:hypothetical protein
VIARAILPSVGIVACASRGARHDTGASAGAERLTLEVGPARVPCTGEARTQCLRVRVLPDTAWQTFYATIDGFGFEEGFRWRLDVERRRVPNPPADASRLSYRLIRVISKEPAR